MTVVRKAVFPAAGLGTRFLPATKAQPKEMLPLVDKPTIQYVVEEAVASGLDEIILVTGRNKRAIEDHFDAAFELEYYLQDRGKTEELAQIRTISELATVSYVRQKEPLGLGHAILCARPLVGDEPFGVFLGDDIIVSRVPCMRQLLDVFERHDGPVLAVMRIPKEEIGRYGVIRPRGLGGNVFEVLDLVEKPDPKDAPSDLPRYHRPLHPHPGSLSDPRRDAARLPRGDPTHQRPPHASRPPADLCRRVRGTPARHRRKARLPQGHGGDRARAAGSRRCLPRIPEKSRSLGRTSCGAATCAPFRVRRRLTSPGDSGTIRPLESVSSRLSTSMANQPKRTFHTASEPEIKAGQVSDVYFQRTIQILKAKGLTKRVKAEIRLKSFPQADWSFGILAGIEEVAGLLEGLPVDVWAMDEGTVFGPHEPVLVIEGTYIEWAEYETALLGLLCQASGIATKAARCKRAAGERAVISFGARRMHPALAPMIERNAFVGGCDGVAVTKAAELIDADPTGTIPHALVLMFGDTVEALQAFHEVIDPKVRRVALIDTLQDEKFEAIRVAQALGKDLYAVRLDTPSSRRGDFFRILEEVRWELDIRGFEHVKIFASGGIDEYEILKLNSLVDGYGVGTSIANAPVLSFALDIMEIEGKPMAKRGKRSGAKQVWRLPGALANVVLAAGKPTPVDAQGRPAEALLKPLIKGGKIIRDLPPPRTLRDYVIEQMARIELAPARERGLRGDY